MKTSRYPVIALVSTLLALPLLAGTDYHDHLGLQLWSMRDQVKTDLPGALDWVKAQGIVEVETAGTGNLSAAEFAQLLQSRGLKAISAHIGYEVLEKDLPGAIQTAKTLGAKYVVTA